jgi:hypothetical protein
MGDKKKNRRNNKKMSWRGRIHPTLVEIKFLFSPLSSASQGLKSFIEQNYWEMKKLNPSALFSIRPFSNIEPHMYFRYGEPFFVRLFIDDFDQNGES